MIDENQQKQTDDVQQLNPELVSAVTATVLQTLQATGHLPENTQIPEKNQQEPATMDLVGLLFFILEKFWMVLIGAVLCAVLMGAAADMSTTTYSATSKLYIVNPNSSGVNIADLQLGTVLTLDYQEVFKTWEVHEMVIEELGLPYTYEQMQSMLSIVNPEDTRILYITATSADAKMAADIANAYAKAAKHFIINTMKGEEPSDFSIALEPSIGHGVSKGKNIVVGFLIGSVLAVGILTLFFVLDDRPRSPESIRQYGGIPTLAIFPANAEKRGGKATALKAKNSSGKEEIPGNYLEITNFPKLDFVCHEAMNTLYTNLSYCGKNVRKIMITSRYAGEGKSYVSMNLLRTYSQLGRKTILIDTDLRASGIQSDYSLRYSTKTHYGLSEYLSGQCGLNEVIYRTNLPNTYMIPAGHQAPNPLQLLDTKTMEKLINDLAKGFDVVLVDTPPIGLLVDAVALAKYCDGALMVVGYRKGRQREIGEAVENIKQTGCKMLGAVLNGVQFNRLSNKHYYYSSERYTMNYNKNYYSMRKKRK
jgi:capsular exopolysaccharide synthesis family protein